MKYLPTFLFLLFFLLLSFKKGDITIHKLPKHFPKTIYGLEKNPLDSSQVQLGRALFYDPILSLDSSISCASCHSPYNAFAHTDHKLSHGIYGQIGTRNAPALFNLAWQPSFMWDGAINHIDMQALAPISHPQEMGETINNVVYKISNNKLYKDLFAQTFQDSIINSQRILKSIASFQLSLISANSKYDQVTNGTASFNEKEKKGLKLFQSHCNSCHTAPLFSNYTFKNNGLSVDSTLNDLGKMTVTGLNKDKHLFKVPSLRNLSYTFPYMHDGRFKTLREVLDHYTTIDNNLSVSKELKKPIKLNDNEKTDLISFLLTLDDKSFVFDPNNKFPKTILLNSASKK